MPIWKNRIIIFNLIGLSIISCFSLVKAVESNSFTNFIFWPGGFFIVLSILSTLLIQFGTISQSTPDLEQLGFIILRGLIFGLILMIGSDLFILIFERFFRLEEHFSIASLPLQWISSWYRLFEGLFIYIGYVLLLRYVYSQITAQETSQKLDDLQNQIDVLSLSSMQAQLNPHFLYNAMNSIAMTIRIKEHKKAVEMIVNLNELLRTVLQQSNDQLVKVSDEISLLNKYLNIESIRFGDHVQISVDYDPEVEEYLIPQLIIQPVVENAFKHGMIDNVDKQKIIVTIREEEGLLIVKVFNTVASKINKTDLLTKRGIGLQNTTHRLRKLYGNRFRFQQEILEDGLEFRIIIPAER
ncbi:MAG: histidine kinase [bacterium]|nr:histidine kinase [bacterium]